VLGAAGLSWSGVVYLVLSLEELLQLETALDEAGVPFTVSSYMFVLPDGTIVYLTTVRFNDPNFLTVKSIVSSIAVTYDYVIYTAAQLHSFRAGRYNVFFLDAFDHITSLVYSEENTNLCYQLLLELNQASLKHVVGKGLFNSLLSVVSRSSSNVD
jgi:hypothetical protein